MTWWWRSTTSASGQSNLGLLQRLPISGLKLAPDLVAALGEDSGTPDSGTTHPARGEADGDVPAETLSREAAALVRGLIELGRALELTVVAQGVESESQAATLRTLGCAYAQGPFLEGRDVVVVLEGLSDDAPEVESAPVAAAESLWAPGTLTS